MEKFHYIYGIDDRPPLKYAVLYALQWTIIAFPTLAIVATLGAHALHLDPHGEVRFLQFIVLLSGASTAVQTLWGHRYPIIDGPATALLLTFIVLAPYGIPTLQGGTILGGLLLIGLVLSGKLERVIAYATPNVIGVILMLIAFSLLPHLIRSMTGVDAAHPHGGGLTLSISIGLVVLMATFAHWFSGFWKTVALLIGMLVGTVIFFVLDLPDLRGLLSAGWLSLPPEWIPARPSFYWPAAVAIGCSYAAVLVNSLGSLHGVANITDPERLPSSISRGVLVNGIAGIFCGLFGTVGNVSYSMSPGVILANRVASRYAVTICGVLLMAAAFVPKLAALLALVPAPVVGAALCTAMGAQVGAGLAIVSRGEFTSRDYFVVGLPILIGTFVGFLPADFMAGIPTALQVFLGNGLIMGIFLVLVLEHVLLRKKSDSEKG